MADKDEDLVSEVRIEGIKEAEQELRSYGNTGAEAFDKIGTAADKAGGKAAKAGDQIADGLAESTDAIPKSGKAALGSLEQITEAGFDLGAAFRETGAGIADFLGRAGKLSAWAATGVIALGELSSRFTATARGIDRDSNELLKAQMKANAQGISTLQLQLNQEAAVAKLRRQYVSGAIDVNQYSSTLRELNADYRAQINITNRVQQAQQNLIDDNDRLQESFKQRQAIKELYETLGGPLAQAVIQTGNAYDQSRKKFLDAFGPGLADILEVFTDAVFETGSTVQNSLANAGQAFSKFVSENKDELFTFFDQLDSVIRGVGDVLINYIIPALRAVRAAMNQVADIINAVFGTQFTGATLAAGIAIARITGLFRVATGVISIFTASARVLAGVIASGALRGGLTFLVGILPKIAVGIRLVIAAMGPWGLLLAAVSAALVYLVTNVDWEAFARRAVEAITLVVAFLTGIPARVAAAGAAIYTAIAGGVTTAIAFAITKGEEFVLWVQALPLRVGTFFAQLWTLFQTGAAAAIDYAIGRFNALASLLSGAGSRIATAFQVMWAFITEGATATVATITQLWTAFVEFLAGLPAQVGTIFAALAATIVSSFNNAVALVRQAMAQILAAARQYIQPVIDMVKQLVGLLGLAEGGAASGAGGAGGQGFADGGKVRGGGTSTSDSILAWLSNGEYVIKARSVAKYGKAFFDAINSGRFNLSNALRGFNMGGMVTAMPKLRFADGGGVSTSNRILNLSIMGEQFNGLTAPEDVAEKLVKFAVKKRSRSAGKAPTWRS